MLQPTTKILLLLYPENVFEKKVHHLTKSNHFYQKRFNSNIVRRIKYNNTLLQLKRQKKTT